MLEPELLDSESLPEELLVLVRKETCFEFLLVLSFVFDVSLDESDELVSDIEIMLTIRFSVYV